MRLLVVILAGLLAACSPALTANAAHTQAKLLVAAESVRPGETVLAGIHLQMEAHWHTYWRNPGSSGLATEIKWKLPPGITAGELQWPPPDKDVADDAVSFIYSGEVVLLLPLTVAANAPPGPVELTGTVRWLECSTSCVPGKSEVQAALKVGGETRPSADAALLDVWKKKIPPSRSDLGAKAWWEKAATEDVRPIVLEWAGAGSAKEADFFPYAAADYEIGWKAEPLDSAAGRITLRKEVKKFEGKWPATITGLLVQGSGPDRSFYEATLPVSDDARASAPLAPAAANAAVAPASLAGMLLYAFLGGLILNVMPCVLPVIALKILGFVNQGRSHPGRVRKLGLVYAAGVLTSFLALAALVIGVKQAGHRAGWGMQFSSPEFIVVLTVLVTLVALNLFGLFEINLSGRVLGAAGELSAKEGSAGAFFNGVLATILATPCTAPFLGIALGFAFAQSYAIIVLIFLTAGLGLAAPYVILSWNPAWLRLLPKPGAWMEKFKVAMGFPMLATAVWLFELTPVHYGKRVLWLGLFLVLVALAAWVYGEFVQRGRSRKGLALGFVALVLAGGYAYALEGKLHWREPAGDSSGGRAVRKEDPDGIDWQPWSPEAVASARAAGQPVFVDFTADWCQTCNWNLAHSIEVKPVREKLKAIKAVALVGDYTKFPDNITDELARFGRAGVPLVLVYPRDKNLPPQVLPDGILTQSIVLDALEKAAQASAPGTPVAARN